MRSAVITGLIFVFEIGLLIVEPSVIKVVASLLAALAFGVCSGVAVASR